MLAKSERLTTRQFNEVLSKGRVIHSPLFLARVLAGEKDTKVSTAASKKIAKKAVLRNRIRRRLYEIVRPFFPAIKQGSWIIIFAKSDISEIEQNVLKEDLQKLLKSCIV